MKLKKSSVNCEDIALPKTKSAIAGEVAVEVEMKRDCQRRRNGGCTSEPETRGCDEPLLEESGKPKRSPYIRVLT